jgi:hypothetical protein
MHATPSLISSTVDIQAATTDANSTASLPCVADAQDPMTIQASWRCIGKEGCVCVACPTVGSVRVQVSLTAIP